jgi:hypothetical protein
LDSLTKLEGMRKERSSLEEGDRETHGPKTGLVIIEEKENDDKERFQAK